MRFRPISRAVTFVVLLVASAASARPFRVNQVPNGPVNSCLTCHVYPGGPRNDFGNTIEFGPGFLDGPAGNVVWQPALAAIDSDGDGRTNGTELLDPTGTWPSKPAHPGDPAQVTLPGVPDAPPVVPAAVPASGPIAGVILTGSLFLVGARRRRV